MTPKQRFKKALFAFFKTEILETFGAGAPVVNTIVETRLPHRIGCSIRFDEERDSFDRNMPLEFAMERKIEHAKKELFKEFVKHVEVEIYPLIEPEYGRRVEILLSCFIGRKP